MRGTAASSERVYGWRGSSNTAAVSPTSTSLPRYITAMRAHMARTTARSCEMKT